MNAPSANTLSKGAQHAGPPLRIVAIIYTVLSNAGLVILLGGTPHFPGPWEPLDAITAFFQARPTSVTASGIQLGGYG
jgi:hypothetical protein